MTYTEFQDYFYSYYNSSSNPAEIAFQILWYDYIDLFGECFIRSTFPQFEFNKEVVEYFHFILSNYAIDYQENVKEFKIVCCSASTEKTLWETSLNTNDLSSLYNYFTHRLLIDNAFYQNDDMYIIKIDAQYLTN